MNDQQIRVTWVRSLPDPDAPTAEQIASGVDLATDLQFVRDDTITPSLLPHDPQAFEVAYWPNGVTSVRHIRGDGTPGPWLHTLDGEPVACQSCERCTWNPGPDCGKAEHPHCPTCGHCQGRHIGSVAEA